MSNFKIEPLRLNPRAITAMRDVDPRLTNWPVVYMLNGGRSVYVGETGDALQRLRAHLANPDKRSLKAARIVIDDEFNRSVCLDLESYLINLFAGDAKYEVLNGNAGQTDRDYYRRHDYRKSFEQIFEQLRKEGLFTRSLPEIENRDLFKLSPFKALTPDQALSVEDILQSLFKSLESGQTSMTVVRGEPGTGKTVVAVYLMKLLRDIERSDPDEPADEDARFSGFFGETQRKLLHDMRIGLVVPQQSLRKSIKRVFSATPGLDPSLVLTPFDVGDSEGMYDILLVDEAHRLNQRAAQPSGAQMGRFRAITARLFGEDDVTKTQLDWIRCKSDHQILFVDALQSVRPADLPAADLEEIADEARLGGRLHNLRTQHRVKAGEDYVGYVRALLSDAEPTPTPDRFGEYDLRFFDDLGQMREEILRLDQAKGLARLLAGFAFPWNSKQDKTAYDIERDGLRLRWNQTDKDWVSSKGSVEEVGSIHTIQGYDLNYAGVIVGPDLRYDPEANRLVFDRAHYFDKSGKRNNRMLGITYSDDDILAYVRNIYAVLLTRGILGTFVYVCDEPLREHMRPYFEAAQAVPGATWHPALTPARSPLKSGG